MAANVNVVACKRTTVDTRANSAVAGGPPAHKKCTLDENGCVCLADILTSFNAPLSEEQAWALCFECARCFIRAVRTDRDACYLVEKVDHVFVHKDGLVHNKTILGSGNQVNSNKEGNGRTPMTSERKLVEFLGVTIFDALDFGLQIEEERLLSPDLKRLIIAMAACDDEDDGQTERSSAEADDEGIERDSGENDEDASQQQLFSLTGLIKTCSLHLGVSSAQQADVHYRAVCRALVAEALELSSFLEVVSRGCQPTAAAAAAGVADCTDAHVADLEQLKFADWNNLRIWKALQARLWGQVIRELRHGVQLKKVHYSRTPVEFELTPYEILMEDIRARRYTLNKVGSTLGDIPHTVKKDAHALILDFIRSRPPLRRSADRPLRPLIQVKSPWEKLMDSIKQGKELKPTPVMRTVTRTNGYPEENSMQPKTNGSIQENETPGLRKKRITVDYELLKIGDADEDDVELNRSRTSTSTSSAAAASHPVASPGPSPSPWHRTGTTNGCVSEKSGPISQDVYHSYCDQALEPYDLATQCPSRRAAARRHTIVVCEPLAAAAAAASKSVDPLPSPPPTPPPQSPGPGSLGLQLPHLSWSRSSLQEELFQSKQWQQECLSLTLEEIVHIRSVLTKAELESLPVEGQVKENAEKGKVCFLCMKTTFGIFRRRGHKCRLCQRTVCSKCHSQMRIPTEHFAHVPVVALSPSLLASPEEDPAGRSSLTRSIVSRLMAPAMSVDDSSTSRNRNSVGSAPSSPKLGCNTASSEGSPSASMAGPASLPMPNLSPAQTSTTYTAAANTYKEKLKGLQMVVCLDCKAMVLQIIKSSRSNRTNTIRSFTLNLSPVY